MYDALSNWGNVLLDRAKLQTGARAEGLFAEAVQKYEEALAIRPGTPDVLDNKAHALMDWSRITTGQQAEDLRARAEEANSLARSTDCVSDQ